MTHLTSESQLRRKIGAGEILGIACLAAWCIVTAVVAIRLAVTGRNSVYPLFHETGLHWRGGENLYAHVGVFRYSPLAAAFFGGLSFLPLVLAQYVWLAINLAGLAAGMLALVKRALPEGFQRLSSGR